MGADYSDKSSDPQVVSDYLLGMRNCFIGRAIRIGFDRDSAEDSFQQVVYTALREISRGTVFRNLIGLRKWAFTVHTNYCIDSGRRRKKLVSLGDHDPEMPTDFVEELTRGEDVKALTDAVKRLPDIYRDAIEGVLQGMSYSEIADGSDSERKPLSTTSVRIHRAKGMLRKELAEIVS